MGRVEPDRLRLAFFYGVTLGRSDLPERIAYARTPRKLPVVLSAEEVVGFLQAVKGTRNRVALMTTYAVGLRATEAARLQVTDIDSSRWSFASSRARAARTAM